MTQREYIAWLERENESLRRQVREMANVAASLDPFAGVRMYLAASRHDRQKEGHNDE